jgi:hypothetical protein
MKRKLVVLAAAGIMMLSSAGIADASTTVASHNNDATVHQSRMVEHKNPQYGRCGTLSSGWGGWNPSIFWGIFGWNCIVHW